MLIDEQPTVLWSNDRIREWAQRKGLNKYPVAYVPLVAATHKEQPDVAIIYFFLSSLPIERKVRARLPAFYA